MVQDIFEVDGRVSGVSSRVHHHSTVKGFVIGLDLHSGRNTVGVATVILLSAMHKLDFVHQLASDRVENRIIAIIDRLEHQIFPDLKRGAATPILGVGGLFRGLANQSGNDIDLNKQKTIEWSAD